MRTMATLRLRYIQAFTDRHGKARHYFRRPGYGRVVLPGPVGSAEFNEAYAAALDGRAAPRREVGAERTAPGTLAALIIAYQASGEWSDLRESTRKGYRSTLGYLRAQHGDKPVTRLEPKHVNGILDALADKPGAARNTRKRLRQLLQFAVERGWRSDNPVLAVKRRVTRTEGFTPWSEADIDRFMEAWPSGSRERLAMALLLYTGQRRSDVVGMGRQHVKDGRISVRQIKTDARLRIPLHPRLQAELDLLPAGQLTFLQTTHGKPFSADGFGNYFGAAARTAGLEKRAAHGLRKAAGRRLAEAGCTAKQIAAVLGHSTLSEVERYTRDADQQRLADAAFGRLNEAGS